MIATASLACGTGGMASMKDSGAGGGGGESALPACPASTMDPDGGLPVGDAGSVLIQPGFDATVSGGASVSAVGASPPPPNFFAALYAVPPALPTNTPVRPMSPLYRLDVSPAADVSVTIPLDPAYAGCQAALYENTADVSTYPPPPGPHPWHRLSGDLSMRSVAALVPANADSTGTSQAVVLLAGTCASECAGDCIDFLNDNANCGGCGQACAAPTFCVQGACGGQVLATISPPIGPLLALDGDMVYFVAAGSGAAGAPVDLIEAVPKAGGSTTVVVANAGGHVDALRAFSGTLYWSYAAMSGGTYIASQPVDGADGGAPFTIGGGPIPGIAGPFAVDGSRVYFTVSAPGSSPPGVVSLPIDAPSTSSETMLASTSGGVPAIDTDGSHLAWIDNQSVQVLDLSTPGASPVALGTTALRTVVVDGDAVVMMGGGVKLPAGGFPPPFVLLRVPIDGSPPEELGRPNEPLDFAARAGTVAWTEQYGPGSVWAKRPSRSPVLLLSGGVAGVVALDDQAAYVMTSSTIWRLAIPP